MSKDRSDNEQQQKLIEIHKDVLRQTYKELGHIILTEDEAAIVRSYLPDRYLSPKKRALLSGAIPGRHGI